MLIVVVNGSPSGAGGSTGALAAAAVDRAEVADHEVTLLTLADLDAAALLGRGKDPGVSAAVDAIGTADALVLVTPMYRASYSGLLKVAFDLLDAGALEGSATVLAATGGSRDHFLALDTHGRALVASLGGWTTPTSVYLTGADFVDGVPSAEVREALDRALSQAVHVAGS